MRYLLDTDVLIRWSRRDREISELLVALAKVHEVGITVVNVAEFFSGIANEDSERAGRLLEPFTRWHITDTAAVAAGQARYSAARRGRPLGTPDALVGAVARERRATVVTWNIKDYIDQGGPVVTPEELWSEIETAD